MAKKVIAIILGAADVLLLGVIIFSAATGWRFGLPLASSRASSGLIAATQAQEATEAEEATAPPAESPTTAPTQAPTPAPTQASTEAPAKLPYADSLGAPAAYDFAWVADAQGGNLDGTFLGTSELVGKWKGEIIYDGVWELVTVMIDNDATVTIQPYQINYGDGWEDESGEAPYIFSGSFDINSVNGAGSYGSINLYTFVESSGAQYGVGTFSVSSGGSANVYLVRP